MRFSTKERRDDDDRFKLFDTRKLHGYRMLTGNS
jgi:hypothetical protein